MITRRSVLIGAAGAMASAFATAAYAVGIEPRADPRTVRYRLGPAQWPAGRRLSIAIVSDVHAGEPAFPLSRVRRVVEAANALGADLIVLLGDYSGGAGARRRLDLDDLLGTLATLRAPLGRYAILGNHDYWDGIAPYRAALARAGIPVLENRAERITAPDGAFWLAGTASIVAIPLGRGDFRGLDDLPGTLAQVTDDAPIILLAHEPDLFVEVPPRVALTLSGHTHGGQVRLLGWSPVVPSSFGNRFAYGHVVEAGRHLVVSGGLGTSILPMRLGMPPEITLVELG